jgi:hypothetical protein
MGLLVNPFLLVKGMGFCYNNDMEFKLPRQEITKLLNDFAFRSVRRQKIYVERASKNNLSEIAAVSREIEEYGLPKHLVLKKLKGKLGFGIFLHPDAKPILKGEAIAPYAGEVYIAPQNQGEGSDYAFSLISDLVLSRKEQSILDPKNRYHPRRLYSLDLDADKKGNFTRYINHSVKPNVEAPMLRFPANFRGGPATFEIVYMAKKTIHPGEQLLVCYEDEKKGYWGAIGVKPFPMTPKTFRLNASLEIICT